MQDSKALEEQRFRIMGEMASLGDLFPGSLSKRYHRCGRASCHCQQPGDPGHGPYYILKYRKGDGTATTRSVPASQAETLQEQVGTFQRLRELYQQYLRVSAELCDARRAESAAGAAKKKPARSRSP